MKKLAALTLAGLVLVSAVLFFPASAAARAADYCYTDYIECRENAFSLDTPWYKMAIILTVCDIALGKCLLDL